MKQYVDQHRLSNIPFSCRAIKLTIEHSATCDSRINLIYLYIILYSICLRKVLRVTWKEHVPNQEILRSAELTGIEAMLNQAQLRWSGHVTRMDDSRLPKQLFHAELATGKRHKGGAEEAVQRRAEIDPQGLQHPS